MRAEDEDCRDNVGLYGTCAYNEVTTLDHGE